MTPISGPTQWEEILRPYPRDERVVSLKPTLPSAGTSLWPAILGQALPRTRPLFFEHFGNRAIRADERKLLAKGPAGPWELYNMPADRSERNDLVAHEA